MTGKESPLEKLVRLASVNVQGFQRVERGRVQTVHPHTEMRPGGTPGTGWIAQPLWDAGEKTYAAKGEAIWAKDRQEWKPGTGTPDLKGRSEASVKAHNTAHDTASATTEAEIAADRVQRGARRAARTRGATAQRMAAQRQSGQAGSSRTLGSPLGTPPAGKLQDRVQQMEQDRQKSSDTVSNHPLLNKAAAAPPPAAAGAAPPAPGGGAASTPGPAEQLIRDAATRAIQEAAVKSGHIDQNGVSHVMGEMAQMEAQLTAEQMRSGAETSAVETRVEHGMREEARARLAINLIGILAGILLIAVTGGAGAIIGEVMAFGWTVEIARELVTYHGVESGNHPAVRKALSHPVRQGTAGAVRVAAKVPVVKRKVSAPSREAPQEQVRTLREPSLPTPLLRAQ